ncbi:MAG: hypothetical protein HKP41_05710 [Desulfobacterales bacterium]|nr:hypothetical protein [Deltaproteobacteria bacterium]MBT8360682.1 hypothetical protein [Deltaproteobacteria bacterium]NNK93829.1 hypothetical protein [Desulfobacterales bacterium]
MRTLDGKNVQDDFSSLIRFGMMLTDRLSALPNKSKMRCITAEIKVYLFFIALSNFAPQFKSRDAWPQCAPNTN